ncbi:Protein ltv1 [Saitoella coloradoensis]
MGKKGFINKKTAQTFQLVHRSQRDPLIHDEDASAMVFKPLDAPNVKKGAAAVKTKDDLEAELGEEASHVRGNEGEAANYGILYDDTEYDYMQHVREVGNSIDAIWVEAPGAQQKKKKAKATGMGMALKEDILPAEVLPSTEEIPRNYQNFQGVQDEIAGFQPDMDPRLREVLEALEDEAYVEEDEHVFAELAASGERQADAYDDDEDFWDDDEEEEEDGYATDDTTKASAQPARSDWENEFSKFKQARRGAPGSDDDVDSDYGSVMAGLNKLKLNKNRRGPGSVVSSNYSMSSSAMFRNEGLTLLDDRFDKIEQEYMDDIDEEEEDELAQVEQRPDLESIFDDFLDNYAVKGKKLVAMSKHENGLYQLDEVRRDLGGARIYEPKEKSTKKKKAAAAEETEAKVPEVMGRVSEAPKNKPKVLRI